MLVRQCLRSEMEPNEDTLLGKIRYSLKSSPELNSSHMVLIPISLFMEQAWDLTS